MCPYAYLTPFYAIVILLFLSSSTFAQHDPVQVKADSLANSTKSGEEVKVLIGNFQFYQGSLTGKAERAIQYPQRNVVELFGNVVIRQDTLSLTAPHLIYDGNAQLAKADGHIQLNDRDDHVTSDWMTYNMASGIAEFHKGPTEGVRAIQGNTTLTCQDLTYIRGTQTMISKGKVRVVNDSGMLTCDTLFDARSIGERTAIGNVKASNDSLIIYCSNLFESQHDKKTVATINVQAYSKANNTIQFGDSLIRDGNTGHTLVPKNPLLFIIDSSHKTDSLTHADTLVFDTLRIKSKTMEAFTGDSAKFIATDSVILQRSNFSGTCGKLIYYRSDSLLTMFGSKRQRIWYDSTEIDGDSIVMFQRNNKPERIIAIGHAFATSPSTDSGVIGRVSQLSSRTMILNIVKDTIRTLLAVDNALSIYFVSDNGKPNGLNRASGDTIRIDFEKNAARRIVVLSGTENEYWPDRYIGHRAAAFRLGNYERFYEFRPRIEAFTLNWTPVALMD
ncbi:MAG TPA: OstA-like protein [Candidatus Kapabacteria bacterium]|nr:OstA-like protein [Candidatus Kapabacteria bacterium]